jgi:hypothetical protein
VAIGFIPPKFNNLSHIPIRAILKDRIKLRRGPQIWTRTISLNFGALLQAEKSGASLQLL